MLKVFRSLCYVGTSVPQRVKFDVRAHKCAFLGFKPGVKGYVAYDIHTKEIIISRHAIFHQCIFPCNSSHRVLFYFNINGNILVKLLQLWEFYAIGDL
jgi:hypothetical protein